MIRNNLSSSIIFHIETKLLLFSWYFQELLIYYIGCWLKLIVTNYQVDNLINLISIAVVDYTFSLILNLNLSQFLGKKEKVFSHLWWKWFNIRNTFMMIMLIIIMIMMMMRMKQIDDDDLSIFSNFLTLSRNTRKTYLDPEGKLPRWECERLSLLWLTCNQFSKLLIKRVSNF